MGNDEVLARVAAATVWLPKLGGQGVLVHGGFVLTATHCIEWTGDGGMALGDFFLERIETKSGATFTLAPVAADPVSDLAVLAAPDHPQFGDERAAFEQWAATVKPVALSGAFEEWCAPARAGEVQSFRVQALAHTGEWIAGQATRVFSDDLAVAPRVWVESSSRIRGGTSGGPIIDDSGKLVSVVSTVAVREDGPTDGAHPSATYALPHWALSRIRRAAALRSDPLACDGEGEVP